MARTAGRRRHKATVIFQRYYVVKSNSTFSQRVDVGRTGFTFQNKNALLSQKKKQQINDEKELTLRSSCHSSRNDEKNVLMEGKRACTFVKHIVSSHERKNRTSMMIESNTRPTIPNKAFSLMMKEVQLMRTTKFRTDAQCKDGLTAKKKYDNLETKTKKTASTNHGNGKLNAATSLVQCRFESSSIVSSSSSSKLSFCATPALRGIYQTPSGKWKTELIHHQGNNQQNFIDGLFETRERAALAYEMAREQVLKDACPIRIQYCMTIILETLNSTTTNTSNESEDDDDGPHSPEQPTTCTKASETAAEARQIYFHKSSGKWEANLYHRADKQSYIGIFDTLEQASCAYEKAPRQCII